MDSQEPMLLSLWKFLRQILFGNPSISTPSDHQPVSNELAEKHKDLTPSKLISNLDYLYRNNAAVPEKIARYQADVDYLVDLLDSYTGDELGQFISEINELAALISLAQGNVGQARTDLEYALSLNKTGKWILSETGRKQLKLKAFSQSSPLENQALVEKQTNNRFRNRWTEEIGGFGYSPNSKFNQVRHEVFARDKYKCTWCGSNVNLTVDHILERRLGGTNELSNLRTLCKDCHERRHGRQIFNRDFDVDDDYGFTKSGNDKIRALIKAADQGHGITIAYEDRDGIKSLRTIHPHRIYKSRYLYVNAFCELDGDDRMFRLSRMKISTKTGNKYLNRPSNYKVTVWEGSKSFHSEWGQTIYSRPSNQGARR